MKDSAEHFLKGKEAYEDSLNVLFEIYKYLPLKARKELFLDKNKKIVDDVNNRSFINMRDDFNSLLQYALLDAGLSSDVVEYTEMLFIADIGDMATRIDHLLIDKVRKHDPHFKHTYLMLPDATREELDYIKTCIYEYLEPAKARIMKAFCIANQLSKKTITDEFLPYFSELFIAFLSLENRMEKEDPSIAVGKMREVFFNHISDYKSKVKGLLK